MKIRRSISAASAAIMLGGIGTLIFPGVASAHSVEHTLKFTSVTVKSVSLTKTAVGLQDTDINTAGKTIGFDDVYLTFTGRNTAAGAVALEIKGGFLYGTIITTNAGRTFSGKVTGGTGAFARATGRITAKAITSSKTAIRITYTT